MKVGFLGRFQPFHLGHFKVVEAYEQKYDIVFIVGSSGKSGTEENPLDFEQRKKLIESCFPEKEILELKDFESDKKWLEQLEQKDIDVVMSRNQKVADILEGSDIDVIEHDEFDRDIYSGTELRRRIRSDAEWRYLIPKCSKDTLEGLIEEIKDTGIQYNFEPGWKRENSMYGTAEK